jgi:hypothetical protein
MNLVKSHLENSEGIKGESAPSLEERIKNSHLILYIASHASVYEAPECRKILEVAENEAIPIIPIKGSDVTWGNLMDLKIARELGKEYDPTNFTAFLEDMKHYIYNYKRNVNIMEKAGRSFGITRSFPRFLSQFQELEVNLEKQLKGLSNQVDSIEKREKGGN